MIEEELYNRGYVKGIEHTLDELKVAIKYLSCCDCPVDDVICDMSQPCIDNLKRYLLDGVK